MNNITPKDFLSELKAHNKEQYAIVTTLRTLIRKNKTASEEIKYGGLLYSIDKPYTGIFVYKNHVTMEFSNGAELTDPKGLLNGTGKFRRNLTFTAKADIDQAVITKFLKQAASLAKQVCKPT